MKRALVSALLALTIASPVSAADTTVIEDLTEFVKHVQEASDGFEVQLFDGDPWIVFATDELAWLAEHEPHACYASLRDQWLGNVILILAFGAAVNGMAGRAQGRITPLFQDASDAYEEGKMSALLVCSEEATSP